MLRIGHGYDVHQLVSDRALVLGGVTVPHSMGLLGHSDADVLTHALADAILGALREGDIGKLFPDTNPVYKGVSSLELLRKVVTLMRSHGFELVDCDCTIVAQAPKLAPHREEMRCNLASAMDVPVDCVGIKATTTEKLGFVGQEQGIAAWAVALLQKQQKQ